MPTIIVLQDDSDREPYFETLHFQLKEDIFPVTGLRLIQSRIRAESMSDIPDIHKIIEKATETIEELGFTLLPYSLYIIKY